MSDSTLADGRSTDRPFKALFVCLALVTAIAMPVLSRDFGITQDEYTHNHHGGMLLDYFEGKSDLAIQGPYQPDGSIKSDGGAWTPDQDPSWITMNLFGGVFDLVCAFLNRHISRLGTYETRHLVGSLFGILAFVFTGLLAARIGGWRAGFLALLFSVLSPRLVGHSMNNPKDLPFAALHIFCLYHLYALLMELPRIRLRRAACLAAGIAIAIDIRISGLLIIAYAPTFAFLRLGLRLKRRMRAGRTDWLHEFAWPMVGILATVFAGYFGAAILWPRAHLDPLRYPLQALRFMSSFDIFDSYNLFQGRWIHRWEIPWDYLPTWIWITLPPFASLGIVLTPLLFTQRFSWRRARELYAVPMLAFATVFPIAYIIAKNSNVYDEARHVLFVVPVLLVLSALSIEAVLRQTRRHPRLHRLAFLALFALAFEPLSFMVRNHPLEGLYFSPLIGGIRGAFGRYEIDYWSESQRQAVEWIVRNSAPGTQDHPVRIRSFYGDPTCSRYFIDKYPGYKYVAVREQSPDWDYSIVSLSAAKFLPRLYSNWPPPGAVHTVDIDGFPIEAVMRNPLTDVDASARTLASNRPPAIQSPAPGPSPAELLQLGLNYYNRRNFRRARAIFEQLVQAAPESDLALNDLAATYGALGQWREEAATARRAIAINPGFQLARNNLAYAESRMRQEGRGRTGSHPPGK